MRVMQIVADGGPGGGTTHVLQVLRGLGTIRSLGLITQRNSYLFDEAASLGIECFGLDFFRSRLDVRVSRKLRQIVQDFQPQLIHAHGGRAGFFCALAAPKVPMVYTVHGYHFLHKRPRIVRYLALRAERMVARHADNIIFVSNHDMKVAQDCKLLLDPNRGNVIYNGIPLAEIPRAESPVQRRIGFIGRLVHQKDPLLFLEVMERLPDYSAVIVGAGDLEDKVRVEIERRGLSRVRMLGGLPRSEALEELSQLQTIVMTSRWEGLPILPLEAMQAGVPVVATNVGGLDEIIENGRSGLLVDGRSVGEMVRAVEQATEDLALRNRIVENARLRVRDIFSEEQMWSGLREVYRQAIVR